MPPGACCGGTGKARLYRDTDVTETQAEPGADAPAPIPGPTAASQMLRSGVEWVVIIVGAILVALIVKTFFVQAFWIPSDSMVPALITDDRVLVNKLSYRLHDVNRGDLIVFERPDCDDPAEPEIKDLIKRVVALGGEQVHGRDGRVHVNGRVLEEPYLPVGAVTHDFGPYSVPAGHLWVMGDNRGISKDSRFLCNDTFTPIDEDSVIGRAFLQVWPVRSIETL